MEDELEAGADGGVADAQRDRLAGLDADLMQRVPVDEKVDVRDGAQVMVIFRGNESYISPNWYPGKHETHQQVPTWNYEVVHAHGRLTIHDDEKFVRGVVARLTRTHEAQEPKPWKMGDSAPAYIDGMLKAIVGLQIAIERIEGKAKLSQNREPRDRLGAADTLTERGKSELAKLMRGAE